MSSSTILSQNGTAASSSNSQSNSNSKENKMPASIPRIGSLAHQPTPQITTRARSASATLLDYLTSSNLEHQKSDRVEEATQTEKTFGSDQENRPLQSIAGQDGIKQLKASVQEGNNISSFIESVDAKGISLNEGRGKEKQKVEASNLDTPTSVKTNSNLSHSNNPSKEKSSDPLSNLENEADSSPSISHLSNLIVPPLNFDLVNAGLYRSGHPNERNFDFMKGLGLKSIVYLAQDTYLSSVVSWANKEGVKVHQFGLSVNKEPFAEMEASVVLSLFEVLLDSRNHPILIHCNKGKYRVGCIVALIRRLQDWSHTSLFEEFERFAGGRGRGADLEFIETFELSKVRYEPAFKPAWL